MNVLKNWEEKQNWQADWQAFEGQVEDLDERNKRYGLVRKEIEDDVSLQIELQLPQKAPLHAWVYQYDLPKTLGKYSLEAKNLGNELRIIGEMPDGELKKLCGHINAFPDRFVVQIPVPTGIKSIEIEWKNEYCANVIAYKKENVHVQS